MLKKGMDGAKQYKHNQQLEELRNLQDKLTVEKAAWANAKEHEEKELEEKRSELLKLQVNKKISPSSSQSSIYFKNKDRTYVASFS